MKLALECRPDMLEMVQPFADFDFILAKEVLRSGEYKDYYLQSPRVKIVDNSVNEEGEPSSLEEIEEAFKAVEGNFLVSPDWLGDTKKTVEAYQEAVKAFGEERVIGVLQGSSFVEVFEALPTIAKGPLVAIPYDICSKKSDSPSLMALRRALIVSNIPSNVPIHLLGFNSLEEFYWYTGKTNIMSIDTGVPVLLGLQGLDILDPLESKAKPTYNEMGELKLGQKQWGAICRNIALLRKYLV